MRASLLRVVGSIATLFTVPALAEAPPVPAPLEAWRAWVMHDQAFRACPAIAQRKADAPADFICAWPGVLKLDADDHGANIAQHWRVDADSWVPLPGDADHWPQQVTVDGQPAPVVVHDGGAALRLTPGAHDVRARIPWSERPQSLRVPPSVGIVALSIDGRPIALPPFSNVRTMGQLFQKRDCPTCGKPMIMARPSGAKGPRVLRCVKCDPLGDERTKGWMEGEPGRSSDPDV